MGQERKIKIYSFQWPVIGDRSKIHQLREQFTYDRIYIMNVVFYGQTVLVRGLHKLNVKLFEHELITKKLVKKI
jgi:hypothetical protein